MRIVAPYQMTFAPENMAYQLLMLPKFAKPLFVQQGIDTLKMKAMYAECCDLCVKGATANVWIRAIPLLLTTCTWIIWWTCPDAGCRTTTAHDRGRCRMVRL